MEKQQLIKKVLDVWTDNIYTEIREIIFAYTLQYEGEELDEIIEEIIERMVKLYTKIKFTPVELSCLLDVVEQDMEDDDECMGKLHKGILKDIYIKLNKLNK
jgi:hypothetical protein